MPTTIEEQRDLKEYNRWLAHCSAKEGIALSREVAELREKVEKQVTLIGSLERQFHDEKKSAQDEIAELRRQLKEDVRIDDNGEIWINDQMVGYTREWGARANELEEKLADAVQEVGNLNVKLAIANEEAARKAQTFTIHGDDNCRAGKPAEPLPGDVVVCDNCSKWAVRYGDVYKCKCGNVIGIPAKPIGPDDAKAREIAEKHGKELAERRYPMAGEIFLIEDGKGSLLGGLAIAIRDHKLELGDSPRCIVRPKAKEGA